MPTKLISRKTLLAGPQCENYTNSLSFVFSEEIHMLQTEITPQTWVTHNQPFQPVKEQPMQLGMVHRPQVPAAICIPGDPRAQCPRGELGGHTDTPHKVGVPQLGIRGVAPHPLNPSEVQLGPAEGPTRPAGTGCTNKTETEMGQLRTGNYKVYYDDKKNVLYRKKKNLQIRSYF